MTATPTEHELAHLKAIAAKAAGSLAQSGVGFEEPAALAYRYEEILPENKRIREGNYAAAKSDLQARMNNAISAKAKTELGIALGDLHHAADPLAVVTQAIALAEAAETEQRAEAARAAEEARKAHANLYANDAIYRQQVDAILSKSDREQNELKPYLETSDKIAAAHGITTGVDKDLASVDKAIAEAIAKGAGENAPELLALRVQRSVLLKEQHQNRVEQLTEKGLPNEVEAMRPVGKAINKYFEAQKENLHELGEKLLEAQEKALMKDNGGYLTQAHVKKLEALREALREKEEEALRSGDSRDIDIQALDRAKRIASLTKQSNALAHNVQDLPDGSTVKPPPSPVSLVASTETKRPDF